MSEGDPRPLFRTGDVLKRSGLSRQVLYQYTSMGIVTEAERTANGHRLYGAEVFERLRIVRELNASGYSLKDIKEIFLSDES
jgi:MerR family transcriptional regulator, copper efflux regulator